MYNYTNWAKKWCEILDQPDLDWKKVYNLPFKVTKNTKLQWLQYRINHHILVTNHFLSKVKIIDNPDCTFYHTNQKLSSILCGTVIL